VYVVVDVDEFVDDHPYDNVYVYDNVDVHVHGSELAGMAEP
jgi:hypothetical protein